jgi:hypothetical protein
MKNKVLVLSQCLASLHEFLTLFALNSPDIQVIVSQPGGYGFSRLIQYNVDLS